MTGQMKPAPSYFVENYASDFRKHGGRSLCGAGLTMMMRSWSAGLFPHLPEFALCQFALNLHNQAFYTHWPQFHDAWLHYSAPFGDTRMCFSGHGMAGHHPDAIICFVQQPGNGPADPVNYTWEDVSAYAAFFFGDYLSTFAVMLPEDAFTPEQYIRSIRRDGDAGVSLRRDCLWSRRHITSFVGNDPGR